MGWCAGQKQGMPKAAPTPDNLISIPLGSGLLETKLYARPARANLVARPRICKLLDDGLSASLILVSAPAGFGKTTVLAEWGQVKDKVRRMKDEGKPSGIPDLHPSKLAWLSLDAADNDPTRFWAYVILSLQAIDDELGETALAQLRSPQPPPVQLILPTLLNEIDSLRYRAILVLDDYHVITSTAVHETLAFLVENLPPNLHLVISTRSDPPLPIAKLRSRGQAVEIRADDLRFTPGEAADFLNQSMGLALSSDQVAALDERTEGWIAGLQMAALSMRGRDAERVATFLRDFAGTHRFIMDYLLEEVLAREPEEVQTFLLQTAILTRLTGPLCDAVTGVSGGQEMLERLEKHNLFVVPLDDNRCWYRYHHLFADLLRARLYRSGPDRVAPLYSRAAEWCEQAGQVAEAVSYVLAAKDYRRAADLIAKYWAQTANSGEIETVWSWLDALPEKTVSNSAPLCVAYCWMLWFRAQIGAIEAHLVDAERAVSKMVVPQEAGTDDAVYTGLLAQVAALRSFVARYHNEFESAIVYAERALSLLPEDLTSQTNAQLRTPIFVALASAYDSAGDLEKAVGAYRETIRLSRLSGNAAGVGITYRLIGVLRLLGRLREADEACREALGYLQEQGMDRLPAAGILHLAMSEVLLERNEIEAAEAQLSKGIELGRSSGRLDAAKNAVHALVRLRQARRDASGALEAVQEAESALTEPKSPLARAELFAHRAEILVRQGALTEAAQCAEEAVRLAGGDTGQTGEITALAACRVHLAQCKPDEAVEYLTRSLAPAERSGRFGAAIEMRILRSLAFVRRGDTRKAEADLERALALAEPEGYVRIFIDESQPMQLLLTQWLAHAEAGPLRDYGLHLLAQFTGEPHGVTAPERASPAAELVEPLTPRELEVLQLIYAGDSNQTIADKLVITISAVKKHTGNILGKLGVTNRAQAIVKARQLGLFPGDK